MGAVPSDILNMYLDSQLFSTVFRCLIAGKNTYL